MSAKDRPTGLRLELDLEVVFFILDWTTKVVVDCCCLSVLPIVCCVLLLWNSFFVFVFQERRVKQVPYTIDVKLHQQAPTVHAK